MEVRFSENAQKLYDELKSSNTKESRMLIKAIDRNKALLEKNYKCGDSIKKKLIPKKYKELYDVKNLFRVELPMFWRMLYSVGGGNIEIVSFVIDILDHKYYNKVFEYKNK